MTVSLEKHRSDYAPPAFLISDVSLFISLDPQECLVKSELTVRRNDSSSEKLVLDGESLELVSVSIDGIPCSDFEQFDDRLEIPLTANCSTFSIKIINKISPATNTSLEGLYMSGNSYCTQCEAEGFRKITYFLDRPDILSVYTVSIEADLADTPNVLSNGNLIETSATRASKSIITWHDPHPKPCYLFALVAGDFDCLEDHFTTRDKRQVLLQVYVEKGRLKQAEFALAALKRAMKWDEQRYGLSYDLDRFMIVAVDFFNMGAMENKGLNIFNSKYVLASPQTATDEDYFNIESIVAHEYFHNWTGNRVTCRDWFQLSLKEGLTVFRDQQFSADMCNPLSTRIAQVAIMREHQFAEDAGPMSHPIRPDSIVEMNNFYTVTVYDKGAEVIRMLHTMLGEEGFQKGMRLYFQRHDGCAVTCDDFVAAMQDANSHDLSHFAKWYSQSGTPHVKVEKVILDDRAILRFSQETPVGSDQAHKAPLYIPIKYHLLDESGELASDEINEQLILKDESAQLALPTKTCIPVLLDEFSAPVRVNYPYNANELGTILASSPSFYARWDAAQRLFSDAVVQSYKGEKLALSTQNEIIVRLSSVLQDVRLPDFLLAELLRFPSLETLLSSVPLVDPLRMAHVRYNCIESIVLSLSSCLTARYAEIQPDSYQYSKTQVNQRKLRNAILTMLAHNRSESDSAQIEQHFDTADNMTDLMAALDAARTANLSLFDRLMQRFEQRYQQDAVVMDKWFALHAGAHRTDILSRLDLLQSHAAFDRKSPNKIRSLIGTFAFYNPFGLHQKSGVGYKYLVNQLRDLDTINPQVAARIVTPLLDWKKFDLNTQQTIREQLGRLLNQKELSKDLFEKVSKSLLQ